MKWLFRALGVSWTASGALLNGVYLNNLGQGDWIWVMSSAGNALGLTTPQAVIDYEASKGMHGFASRPATAIPPGASGIRRSSMRRMAGA